MGKDETKLFYGRTQELKYDGVFVDTTKEKVKKHLENYWNEQKQYYYPTVDFNNFNEVFEYYGFYILEFKLGENIEGWSVSDEVLITETPQVLGSQTQTIKGELWEIIKS